jgi:hypothetical protein
VYRARNGVLSGAISPGIRTLASVGNALTSLVTSSITALPGSSAMGQTPAITSNADFPVRVPEAKRDFDDEAQ